MVLSKITIIETIKAQPGRIQSAVSLLTVFVSEESVVVEIKGQNAVLLEAAAGNLRLGANLYANGNHASDDVGGLGVLGGFDGVDAGSSTGNGPGAPLENSDQGHGAAYGGHGSGGASHVWGS